MARIEWTPELDTGIDVIDDQHRRIVEYINDLYDAKMRNDREAMAEVIDNVIDYTLSHFGFEEVMMQDAGYEFLNAHKRVHEMFVQRVAGLAQRFKDREDVGAELHALLSRWLINHILKEDHHYVPAVKAMTERNSHQEQAKRKGWISRFFGG